VIIGYHNLTGITRERCLPAVELFGSRTFYDFFSEILDFKPNIFYNIVYNKDERLVNL